MAVPLTAWGRRDVLSLGIAVSTVLLATVAVLSVYTFVTGSPWRPLTAGILATGMIGSTLANQSVPLANASLLLAPVVLVIAWLWGRQDWLLGCALLAGTLLLKPLLVPLAMIPLLARRWRPLLVSSASAAFMVLVSLPLTGGFGDLRRVIEHVAHGSVLVGRFSVFNLSLSGFATVHHLPEYAVMAGRLILIVACGLGLVWMFRIREWDRPTVAWMSTLLLLTVYLAGSLSENHYLFTLVPGAVAVLASARSMSARVLAGVALLLMMMPLWRLHAQARQEIWVASEVTLFIAILIAARQSGNAHVLRGVGVGLLRSEPAAESEQAMTHK